MADNPTPSRVYLPDLQPRQRALTDFSALPLVLPPQTVSRALQTLQNTVGYQHGEFRRELGAHGGDDLGGLRDQFIDQRVGRAPILGRHPMALPHGYPVPAEDVAHFPVGVL